MTVQTELMRHASIQTTVNVYVCKRLEAVKAHRIDGLALCALAISTKSAVAFFLNSINL